MGDHINAAVGYLTFSHRIILLDEFSLFFRQLGIFVIIVWLWPDVLYISLIDLGLSFFTGFKLQVIAQLLTSVTQVGSGTHDLNVRG